MLEIFDQLWTGSELTNQNKWNQFWGFKLQGINCNGRILFITCEILILNHHLKTISPTYFYITIWLSPSEISPSGPLPMSGITKKRRFRTWSFDWWHDCLVNKRSQFKMCFHFGCSRRPQRWNFFEINFSFRFFIWVSLKKI